MLADQLGSSPRLLGPGYGPRWLPGEKEVVHAFDSQRLATTDLSGNMSLLPEVSIADAAVADLIVDRQSVRW